MSLDGAKFICLNKDVQQPCTSAAASAAAVPCTDAGVDSRLDLYGKVVAPKGRKFTVGYYMNCDYVLDNDHRAKGVHCEIQCDAFGRVTIHNLSDENPISVNDQIIHKKRPLLHGSRINILEKNYLWHFPKPAELMHHHQDLDSENKTPQKPIMTSEQPPNSCPDLKLHRDVAKRFTVHNFEYCIKSDDEGNISSESFAQDPALEAKLTNMSALESDETDSLVTLNDEKEIQRRSGTPEPENANSLANAGSQQTPEINLINCSQSTENETTELTKFLLSKCDQSDVVITSFSPRVTGVSVEKSFAGVFKSALKQVTVETTPTSVYSTPKSILSETNNDVSRDYIGFTTPATSKKALQMRTTTNSSMHLVDFVTPNKLAPASPFPKSLLKSATKRYQFGDTANSQSSLKDDFLNDGVSSATPASQKDQDFPQCSSTGSVISVDGSTDTSSVIEISSEELTPHSKAPIKTRIGSPKSLSTSTRTPQSSLMKRAIITRANKFKSSFATTLQSKKLVSPTTPKSSHSSPSAVAKITERRSLTTPRRSLAGQKLKFTNPSTSTGEKLTFLKSPKISTSTPVGSQIRAETSSSSLRGATRKSPLHSLRKSFDHRKLSPHISKLRKSMPGNAVSLRSRNLAAANISNRCQGENITLKCDAGQKEVSETYDDNASEGSNADSNELSRTFVVDDSNNEGKSVEATLNSVVTLSPIKTEQFKLIKSYLPNKIEYSNNGGLSDEIPVDVAEVHSSTPRKQMSLINKEQDDKSCVEEVISENFAEVVTDDTVQNNTNLAKQASSGEHKGIDSEVYVESVLATENTELFPANIDNSDAALPLITDDVDANNIAETTIAVDLAKSKIDCENLNKTKDDSMKMENVDTEFRSAMGSPITVASGESDGTEKFLEQIDLVLNILDESENKKKLDDGETTTAKTESTNVPDLSIEDEKENKSSVSETSSLAVKAIKAVPEPKTPNFCGVRDMLRTPKVIDTSTPRFIGLRNLMRTPKSSNFGDDSGENESLEAVQSLLKTPSLNKKKDLLTPVPESPSTAKNETKIFTPRRSARRRASMSVEITPTVTTPPLRTTKRRASASAEKSFYTPKRSTKLRRSFSFDDDAAVVASTGQTRTPRKTNRILTIIECTEDMGDIVDGESKNRIVGPATEEITEVATDTVREEHKDKIYAVIEESMCEEIKLSGEGENLIIKDKVQQLDSTGVIKTTYRTLTEGLTETPTELESKHTLTKCKVKEQITESEKQTTVDRKHQDGKLERNDTLDKSDYEYGRELTNGAKISGNTQNEGSTFDKEKTPKSLESNRIFVDLPKPSKHELMREPKSSCEVDSDNLDKFDSLDEFIETPKSELKLDSEFIRNEEPPTTSAEARMTYLGMREMLRTPKHANTPQLKGIRELMKTPKGSSTPKFSSIKQLMTTPDSTTVTEQFSKQEFIVSEMHKSGSDSLNKFFTTPRGKDMMIPTLPPSAVLERNTNSVELVPTTEYDLNASQNENPTEILEDMLQTPINKGLKRCIASYVGDTKEETEQYQHVEPETLIQTSNDDHVKKEERHHLSAEEAFDELIGQTSVLEKTTSLKVYSHKRNFSPLQPSPFSAGDEPSELPKTDLQEWLQSVDPTNNAPHDGLIDRCENEEKEITFTESMLSQSVECTSRDPISDSVCESNELRKITLNDTEDLLDVSAVSSIMDPLLAVPGKTILELTTKSEEDTEYPVTRTEAEMSGVEILDQTIESEFSEQLIVTDSDSIDENFDQGPQKIQRSKDKHNDVEAKQESSPVIIPKDSEPENNNAAQDNFESTTFSKTINPEMVLTTTQVEDVSNAENNLSELNDISDSNEKKEMKDIENPEKVEMKDNTSLSFTVVESKLHNIYIKKHDQEIEDESKNITSPTENRLDFNLKTENKDKTVQPQSSQGYVVKEKYGFEKDISTSEASNNYYEASKDSIENSESGVETTNEMIPIEQSELASLQCETVSECKESNDIKILETNAVSDIPKTDVEELLGNEGKPVAAEEEQLANETGLVTEKGVNVDKPSYKEENLTEIEEHSQVAAIKSENKTETEVDNKIAFVQTALIEDEFLKEANLPEIEEDSQVAAIKSENKTETEVDNKIAFVPTALIEDEIPEEAETSEQNKYVNSMAEVSKSEQGTVETPNENSTKEVESTNDNIHSKKFDLNKAESEVDNRKTFVGYAVEDDEVPEKSGLEKDISTAEASKNYYETSKGFIENSQSGVESTNEMIPIGQPELILPQCETVSECEERYDDSKSTVSDFTKTDVEKHLGNEGKPVAAEEEELANKTELVTENGVNVDKPSYKEANLTEKEEVSQVAAMKSENKTEIEVDSKIEILQTDLMEDEIAKEANTSEQHKYGISMAEISKSEQGTVETPNENSANEVENTNDKIPSKKFDLNKTEFEVGNIKTFVGYAAEVGRVLEKSGLEKDISTAEASKNYYETSKGSIEISQSGVENTNEMIPIGQPELILPQCKTVSECKERDDDSKSTVSDITKTDVDEHLGNEGKPVAAEEEELANETELVTEKGANVDKISYKEATEIDEDSPVAAIKSENKTKIEVDSRIAIVQTALIEDEIAKEADTSEQYKYGSSMAAVSKSEQGTVETPNENSANEVESTNDNIPSRKFGLNKAEFEVGNIKTFVGYAVEVDRVLEKSGLEKDISTEEASKNYYETSKGSIEKSQSGVESTNEMIPIEQPELTIPHCETLSECKESEDVKILGTNSVSDITKTDVEEHLGNEGKPVAAEEEQLANETELVTGKCENVDKPFYKEANLTEIVEDSLMAAIKSENKTETEVDNKIAFVQTALIENEFPKEVVEDDEGLEKSGLEKDLIHISKQIVCDISTPKASKSYNETSKGFIENSESGVESTNEMLLIEQPELTLPQCETLSEDKEREDVKILGTNAVSDITKTDVEEHHGNEGKPPVAAEEEQLANETELVTGKGVNVDKPSYKEANLTEIEEDSQVAAIKSENKTETEVDNKIAVVRTALIEDEIPEESETSQQNKYVSSMAEVSMSEEDTVETPNENSKNENENANDKIPSKKFDLNKAENEVVGYAVEDDEVLEKSGFEKDLIHVSKQNICDISTTEASKNYYETSKGSIENSQSGVESTNEMLPIEQQELTLPKCETLSECKESDDVKILETNAVSDITKTDVEEHLDKEDKPVAAEEEQLANENELVTEKGVNVDKPSYKEANLTELDKDSPVAAIESENETETKVDNKIAFVQTALIEYGFPKEADTSEQNKYVNSMAEVSKSEKGTVETPNEKIPPKKFDLNKAQFLQDKNNSTHNIAKPSKKKSNRLKGSVCIQQFDTIEDVNLGKPLEKVKVDREIDNAGISGELVPIEMQNFTKSKSVKGSTDQTCGTETGSTCFSVSIENKKSEQKVQLEDLTSGEAEFTADSSHETAIKKQATLRRGRSRQPETLVDTNLDEGNSSVILSSAPRRRRVQRKPELDNIKAVGISATAVSMPGPEDEPQGEKLETAIMIAENAENLSRGARNSKITAAKSLVNEKPTPEASLRSVRGRKPRKITEELKEEIHMKDDPVQDDTYEAENTPTISRMRGNRKKNTESSKQQKMGTTDLREKNTRGTEIEDENLSRGRVLNRKRGVAAVAASELLTKVEATNSKRDVRGRNKSKSKQSSNTHNSEDGEVQTEENKSNVSTQEPIPSKRGRKHEETHDEAEQEQNLLSFKISNENEEKIGAKKNIRRMKKRTSVSPSKDTSLIDKQTGEGNVVQKETSQSVLNSELQAVQVELDTSSSEGATPKSKRGVPRRAVAAHDHNYDESSDSEMQSNLKRRIEKASLPKNVTNVQQNIITSSDTVTSRGRKRKPTAIVQQFLEGERAKSTTPKKRVLLHEITDTSSSHSNAALASSVETPVTSTPKPKKRGRVRQRELEVAHSDQVHGKETTVMPPKRGGRRQRPPSEDLATPTRNAKTLRNRGGQVSAEVITDEQQTKEEKQSILKETRSLRGGRRKVAPKRNSVEIDTETNITAGKNKMPLTVDADKEEALITTDEQQTEEEEKPRTAKEVRSARGRRKLEQKKDDVGHKAESNIDREEDKKLSVQPLLSNERNKILTGGTDKETAEKSEQIEEEKPSILKESRTVRGRRNVAQKRNVVEVDAEKNIGNEGDKKHLKRPLPTECNKNPLTVDANNEETKKSTDELQAEEEEKPSTSKAARSARGRRKIVLKQNEATHKARTSIDEEEMKNHSEPLLPTKISKTCDENESISETLKRTRKCAANVDTDSTAPKRGRRNAPAVEQPSGDTLSEVQEAPSGRRRKVVRFVASDETRSEEVPESVATPATAAVEAAPLKRVTRARPK